MAIEYNDSVVGVLLVGFSAPLSDFVGFLALEESLKAISISGPYLDYQTLQSLKGFSVVKQFPIAGTGLNIQYWLNDDALTRERNEMLLTVGFSIVIGLVISFSLLTLLGRKLLLNPYRKLEEMQASTNETLHDLKNLQNAIDEHSIVAMTDIKGTITFANEKFSEISGYSNEELIGQNHRLLNSGFHEKDFFTNIYKMISKGKVWRAEVCNRNKQVDLYWVDTTVVPMKDAAGKVDSYIAIRSDITNLKNAEEQIVASSMRMQLATNASGIGIWEWDLESNELVWDDWMYALYGVSPSQFCGAFEAWEASVHPDDIEDSRQKLQDAVDGKGVFEPEFRVVHPNGDIKHIKAKAQVFRDSNGHPVKMIGVNCDITDRVQALEMDSEARDRAEHAAQAKSEFLANMSHEIRTPMNGVIGMLELLKHTEMNSDQSHKVKVASSSAQSLLTLINDILDLSKIEAGKLELELIPFDIGQLLSDSFEALGHLVDDAHKVQLLIDIADVNVAEVSGDPGRIRKIVTNLISNAIKFTSQGQVVLKARIDETEGDKLRMCCSVKDTGIGIPAEKVSTLFEQFTQVDASTTRKYGGTRLGLSIAQHLCKLMNGQISVESEQGKGSCFTFEVELGKCADHKASMYPATLADLNVLVVDSNSTSRAILLRQCEAWGINAEMATSADEALRTLPEEWHEVSGTDSSENYPFDFVVIDENVEGVPAKDLCVLIDKRAKSSRLKLLVLSAVSERSNAYKLDLDIAIRQLQKPLIPSLMLDALIESDVAENGLPEKQGDETVHDAESGPRRLFDSNVRVLLVEDNRINQLVATSLLKNYGLDVEVAENGKEAIDAISRDNGDTSFSLVLMDCHMPEMDGYEATKNIREGAAGDGKKNIPIVAMIANAMQGDKEKCLEAGMDDYVTKPIDEKLLQNALIKWINEPVDSSNEDVSEEETIAEPPELKVWDSSRLRKSLFNKPEKMLLIIDSYLAASVAQKTHFLDSIEKGDPQKIALVAHSIKGSVASLGGEKLAKVVGQMELAAKDNDLSTVRSCLNDFESAYTEFTESLEKYSP